MKALLVLANLVVASLLSVVIALQVLSEREAEIEDAYVSLSRTTAALAEHTQQTITALDLALQTIVTEITPYGTEDPAALEEIHTFLRNRQSGSTSAYSFYIINAQGRLAATARTLDHNHSDISTNPEYVGQLTAVEDKLFIGLPRMGVPSGAAEGRWIINLSRRIENTDGSFAGVAGTNMSVAYLDEVYDDLLLGAGSTVALLNLEGRVLMKSPFAVSALGTQMAETAPFLTRMAQLDSEAISEPYRDLSQPGLLAAYRFVRNGELVVYADWEEAQVLAAWRARSWFKAWLGGLAFVLFASVSLGSFLYLQRRESWQREQTRRLRLLAESSAALLSTENLDDLLDKCAALVRSLTGAKKSSIVLGEKVGSGNKEDASVLIVPVRGKDERRLGYVSLKKDGEESFGDDDQFEVQQLTNVTGLLVENMQVVAAREEALLQANSAKDEIEKIFSSISDAVFSLDTEWRFVYLNDEAERILEKPESELLGNSIWDVYPEAVGGVFEIEYRRARNEGSPLSFEQYFDPLNSWLSVRVFPHHGGITVYFQDTTEQKETESRLRQAQKMDAIGQLTGGIAHDFNNLLTVMLGNADLVEEYLVDAPESIRMQASVIRKAGERAAELTHRLLAFARRQPLDPRRTNVNALISDVEEMMGRTLGENFEIELVRGAGLWKAIVDPHELENAILNLAINARDAMADGGKLTIETGNASVDEDYAAFHQMLAGQYVVIAVSDTGTGMSKDVIAKAFDPFFTTKAEGKGSGLGLSMVFGFASQSGGHVKIYSELGHGTTIKIYLPRAVDNVETEYEREASVEPIKRGNERILLLEDDDLVLDHASRSLKSLGYLVTECSNGEAALKHLSDGKRFDLLLTDVVLAGGISGKQVAIKAADLAPDIKILFMSGYTENAIVHHGRLDRGVVLLNKPFRLVDLARKVRQVLDA